MGITAKAGQILLLTKPTTRSTNSALGLSGADQDRLRPNLTQLRFPWEVRSSLLGRGRHRAHSRALARHCSHGGGSFFFSSLPDSDLTLS